MDSDSILARIKLKTIKYAFYSSTAWRSELKEYCKAFTVCVWRTGGQVPADKFENRKVAFVPPGQSILAKKM